MTGGDALDGITTELVIAIVASALIVFAIAFWLKGRSKPSIESTLKAIAVESASDVLIPDGMEGEIHLEYLLLTAKGVLVLDVKRYEGAIFAGDRMNQWTSIAATGRSTFQNPLPSLYDRVAAVRQLVRDLDVRGGVLFPSQADFSKGRPADVLLPEDLLAIYAKPDKAELSRIVEAFEPHWERLRSAWRPAD